MKILKLFEDLILEQRTSFNKQFAEGDIWEGERDRDDRGKYILKIISIETNGTDGFITVYSISKKGKYNDKILDGKERHKIRFDNKLIRGNEQLGYFKKLIKKSSGATSTSTPTDREYGGGRADKKRDPEGYGSGGTDKTARDINLGGGKASKGRDSEGYGSGSTDKTVRDWNK